jgi:hypothetical protein
MNLQRAKKQLHPFCERHMLVERRALNIACAHSYSAASKHILAMGIAYRLSYTASSNLHERILEYLAMEYPY